MFACDLCDIVLRDNYNLKLHWKSNHECKFCKKTFESKLRMKDHMKVCIEGQKLLRECCHCKKRFKHKGNYEEHENVCGLNKLKQTEYKCHICNSNKTFTSNLNLVNHLHQHEKLNYHQCQECEEKKI